MEKNYIDPNTDESVEQIFEYCAKNNPPSFNYNKALEEAIEFQEVLIKLQTKSEDKKPNPEELIKEFGDLFYRGTIAIKTVFPNLTFEEIFEKVSDHIEYKLRKLIGYYNEGKYKGGL